MRGLLPSPVWLTLLCAPAAAAARLSGLTDLPGAADSSAQHQPGLCWTDTGHHHSTASRGHGTAANGLSQALHCSRLCFGGSGNLCPTLPLLSSTQDPGVGQSAGGFNAETPPKSAEREFQRGREGAEYPRKPQVPGGAFSCCAVRSGDGNSSGEWGSPQRRDSRLKAVTGARFTTNSGKGRTQRNETHSCFRDIPKALKTNPNDASLLS